MSTMCRVIALPKCDFCGAEARYDFRTAMGPWAMGCHQCWEMYRMYDDLGTGKGQLWLLPNEWDAIHGRK